MTTSKPHFLLFCDGNTPANGENAVSQRGRWRFVLENVETGQRIEATDIEQGCATDRCALISVLRGLEALEQPSRVTLITTSRYVSRGLQYGLVEWRDNDFSWEHFGAVQPIRNADIWKRIDRTLAFHQVQCRWMAQEEADTDVSKDELKAQLASNEKSEQAPRRSGHSTPVEHQATPVASATATRVGRHATSTAMAASRSELPNRTHQRVFVDTPTQAPVVHSENNPSMAAKVALSNVTTETLTRTEVRSKFLDFVFYLPNKIRMAIGWIWRCQKQLCKNVWAAILAIDDWLDSFLRCMFMLEPKSRRNRP